MPPQNNIVARLVLRQPESCLSGGEGVLVEALWYFTLLDHYLSF